MKNLSRVRSEFTRQAEAFADSAVLRGAEVMERIAEALESGPAGRLLDLAFSYRWGLFVARAE